MAKGRLEVGTAVAEPGKWTRGELVLGYYPDGPITSPVNILCGRQPGPTLWVQGCIHGAEIGGTIGTLRLIQRLDPNAMSGTIVQVTQANPLAFRAPERNTPVDGENLNRVFPGSREGAHSRQAAAILFETALDVADAMMDLHSGGEEAVVPFYALYWDDGSDAAKESGRLARAAGTPDIWASRDGWLGGAMFTNFTKRGKPALIIECGGGGPLPDQHIDNFTRAVEGVARAMGILAGPPARQERYRLMRECLLVYNRMGGFLLPEVEAGDVVAKGQVVARLMNPHGDIVEEMVSPNGPAYIAAIRRRYLPVHSGAMIAECIAIVDDADAGA